MKSNLWLLGSAVALGLAVSPSFAANPLLAPSTLPFQAPRFDLIKDSDYQPAIEAGMAEQIAAIAKIANDRAAPTFANTIEAMERSSETYDRATNIFDAVVQANTNPGLDAIQTAIAPKRTAHSDAIYMNVRLFQRVKTLHDKAATLRLSTEQAQLLKVIYEKFVQAGANLSEADKAKLRDLNTRIATLETAFSQKLVAAAKAGALVVDDKAKLAGLSEAEVAAAAKDAADRDLSGKYVLPLQNTTQQPLLTSLTDRATREALFRQSWSRAEKGDANDTRASLEEIALLRAQKAQLLGFKTWGHYKLSDQMAETPEAAKGFMSQLVGPLAVRQKEEAAEIQAAIAQSGGKFTLAPWDWQHYQERVRTAKYELDQNALKPYFEVNRVLEDGVFYAANQLYGLTFRKRTDLPVYQPDVVVYTVFDADGSELGLMYFDFFKRDNKSGGAWMSNFVGQSKLLGTKPVIYNVENFQKPADGQPALVTWDDVTTMFHEFGHALHGLFADQVYPTVSGTNTARDFVEFPSQFNEHWAIEPKVLANYARHHRTGAAIPADLIEKIKRAESFGKGHALGEVVEAAMLDMDWHSLPASMPKQSSDAFEAKSLGAMAFDTKNVPPRYRSSYFLHIWGNGYSAGYYAYLWTQMLENDAYKWFVDHGGMTRANGQRFRDLILSRGHSLDYGPMFRAFYGRDPDIGPMLEDNGLTGK